MGLPEPTLKDIAKYKNSAVIEALSPEDRAKVEAILAGKPVSPSAPPVPVLFQSSTNPATTGRSSEGAMRGAIPGIFGIKKSEIAQTLRELPSIPGAVAIGLLEGVRRGGLEETGNMLVSIAKFGLKSLIPGTVESGKAGAGILFLGKAAAGVPFALSPALGRQVPETKQTIDFIKTAAKDELNFLGKLLDEPEATAKENPLRTLSALSYLASGPAAIARKILEFGERKISGTVLQRAARVVGNEIGGKVEDLQRAMNAAGFNLSEEQALEILIQNDPEVKIFRVAATDAPHYNPAPMPHGQEAKWIREAGAKGGMAYDEVRALHWNEEHLKRLISERARAAFDGLDADARSGLQRVVGVSREVAGVPTGVISRAGELLPPGSKKELFGISKKFLDENATDDIEDFAEFAADIAEDASEADLAQAFYERFGAGTKLLDGRVLGNPTDSGGFQTWRYTTVEDAQFLKNKLLTKHPKAKEVFDALMAEQETPIVTWQGTILPKLSLKRLKDQYGIVGLEKGEEESALALVKKAFGADAVPNNVGFAYVPEIPLKGMGLGTAFRTALTGFKPIGAPFKASVRYRKTGRAAEKAFQTEKYQDLLEGIIKTHSELGVEQARNDASKSIIRLLAEPLTPEDIKTVAAGRSLPSTHRLLSKTGVYGSSAKFQKFVEKNRDWFEVQGIAIPDIVDAATIAQGKGLVKIPALLADEIGWFKDVPLSVNTARTEAFKRIDQAFGDLLAVPLITWLSAPSSANRNFISQTLTFAPKIIRDAYRGVIQSTIPAWRYEQLPFQSMFSDFSAYSRMHGSTLRRELPREIVGSTLMSEMDRGPVSRAISTPMQLWGFNYHDVAYKRLNIEATLDGLAKQAYARGVRNGTVNVPKADFIRQYRANIPKSHFALALRESDTWGGYDYGNIPDWLRTVRESNVGRALLPYPTYYTKLIGNTYHELGWDGWGAYQNIKKISTGAIPEKVNSLANLLAGATMGGLTWMTTGGTGSLLKTLSDPELREELIARSKASGVREITEQEIPIEFRKTGRFAPVPEHLEEHFGMMDDESIWFRYWDMPFFGDMGAARSILGGDYDFSQFMNDRIALGPLHDFLMIMFNMSDDWNREVPRATRTGKLVADVLPFKQETQALRKLVDTTKRQVGQKEQGAFRNFLEGMADNYPFLSSLLPPRPASTESYSIKHYAPAETLAAYWFLNARNLNETEREAAIATYQLVLIKDERIKLDRERVTELVEKVMDEFGRTEAGEAKRKVKGRAEELLLQSSMASNAILIGKSYDDGGMKEATKTATALLADEIESTPQDRFVRPEIRNSMSELLRKLQIMEEHGLTGHMLSQAPRRQREAIIEEMQSGKLLEEPPE